MAAIAEASSPGVSAGTTTGNDSYHVTSENEKEKERNEIPVDRQVRDDERTNLWLRNFLSPSIESLGHGSLLAKVSRAVASRGDASSRGSHVELRVSSVWFRRRETASEDGG